MVGYWVHNGYHFVLYAAALPWVCNHFLVVCTWKKGGLFWFDFFFFFFKWCSDAHCVSSKALWSSVQLISITMSLEKKIKITSMLLVTLNVTLFIIWVEYCHLITWIILIGKLKSWLTTTEFCWQEKKKKPANGAMHHVSLHFFFFSQMCFSIISPLYHFFKELD